jgi:hypothetical protein
VSNDVSGLDKESVYVTSDFSERLSTSSPQNKEWSRLALDNRARAVQNQGNLAETFNVTLYANATALAMFMDITLPSGALTNIAFDWNTSGFAKGTYIIRAVADTLAGETYTADNTLVVDPVLVSIPGDVAEPHRLVDVLDMVSIVSIYESELGDPEYEANSDIDGNGIVDIFDVVACTSHYEESW